MKTDLILIGLVLAAYTNPLSAQGIDRFGMVAIAAGQTVQVNVVNGAGQSFGLTCHISIVFADRGGNLIGNPESSNFALAPGNVASMSINHPYLLPGERFHVRAKIRKFESKASGQNECDEVRGILEVFDTDTGRTTVVLGLPND